MKQNINLGLVSTNINDALSVWFRKQD